MHSTLVSIIVPCYNQEVFLDETLQSVFFQTYINWECLIINDGSTDNTETIAKQWCEKDKRFQYFNQNNQGVIAARNNAIEKCKGLYVLPLDGDDKIAKDFISEAISFIESNSADIVYGIVETFGAFTERWDKDIFSVKELLIHNLIPVTALYRKQIWEQLGGYKQTMSKGFEDWDFWLAATENSFRIKQLNIPMLYYRQIPNSRSLQIAAADMLALRKQIAVNHINLYIEHLGDPLNLYYKIQDMERQKQLLENSWAYKIGNIILAPFKLFQKLLK